MTKLALAAACLSALALGRAAAAENPMTRAGDRTDTVLTCGWTADGAPVTLPHTWNVPDGEDGPTADGAPEGVYRPGRGWTARPSKTRFDKEQKDTQQSVRSLGYARKCVTYRHDLPDPDPVRRYFVRCEAAGTHATVVVNGRVAGRHENAFTGFTFEITGAMRKAKNVLEIVVDNFYDQQGLPITADYTMFGGLYRPVHLIVTPAACFDIAGEGYGPGVTVRADAKTGRVRVEPQVLRPSGKTKVKVSYAVPEAGVTSEANEFAVPGFALWSPESPKLYHLTATLTSEWGTDVVTVPFGFRTAEFREDGFYLNGQKRKLRGVNWHQDFQGKGWAVSHEDIALSARLIKDMGADAVRTAHYPHAQDAYDLCDELGLVAWCELPVTDMTSTGAVSRARARAAVREMTAQYGHHPSIAMWSVSNEVWERGPEGGSKGTIDVHRELDAAFRHDDPTRPTVLASCYPDQTNVNRITTAFGYNTYPGWYFGKPEQISDLLAELVRKNGLTTFALSEYGGGANPGQHENPAPERCRKPNSPWHPEEYQTRHHVVHYREIKRNPRIWGSYVWQMFDSAADSTQSGPIEGINDKGLVTRDRKTLKDAYAFYRANWNPAPQLHLSGARMQSTTNSTYDVLAFCNAGDVTLKVNGRVIGSVTPDEVMCAEWKAVPLASGRNELEVSAKGLPPVRQVLSRGQTGVQAQTALAGGWPNDTPAKSNEMRHFQWEKSRPQVLDWFRRNWFGYAPVGRPDDEVIGENFVSCAGGKVRINLFVALPENASPTNPVPVFVFGDHCQLVYGAPYEGIPTNSITGRGYAYVYYNFNDVAPDRYMNDIRRIDGVFAAYGGWDRPDGAGWGKVAAWAWGFSRVMDWIETRPELDARRVAVVGHSRGGKTALWAAAQDERITMAVSNNSGTGGAHLNEMITPGSEQVYAFLYCKSWNFFCPNFLKFDGRETMMEHDADDLIRLIAPRLVYVGSASKDSGAGPEGEFEATRRASELWRAYGYKGISLTAYPAPGTTDNEGFVGFHLRPGGHKLLPYDWKRYMDFADRHLKRK